ncbi:UNVERIFIED_CONTAM: cyclin-dependent kinase [Hammondia hammondi]|eukprot:XP_008887771.1 cyclin-dependent kinase [Hammondia hammondi]
MKANLQIGQTPCSEETGGHIPASCPWCSHSEDPEQSPLFTRVAVRSVNLASANAEIDDGVPASILREASLLQELRLQQIQLRRQQDREEEKRERQHEITRSAYRSSSSTALTAALPTLPSTCPIWIPSQSSLPPRERRPRSDSNVDHDEAEFPYGPLHDNLGGSGMETAGQTTQPGDVSALIRRRARDAYEPMNVVEFFGCQIEGSTLYLITDFCENNLRTFWEKLLRGLSRLHSHGILHRNLKPENILIRPCTGGKEGPEPAVTRSYRESRRLFYRAPELLLMRGDGTVDSAPIYSFGVDIWSVAIIFMELALLRPPFRADSEMIYLLQIFRLLGTPVDARTWAEMCGLPVPADPSAEHRLFSRQNPFYSRVTAERVPFTRSPPLYSGVSDFPPSFVERGGPASQTKHRAQTLAAQAAIQTRVKQTKRPSVSAFTRPEIFNTRASAANQRSSSSSLDSFASSSLGLRDRVSVPCKTTLPQRNKRNADDGEDTEEQQERKRRVRERDRREGGQEAEAGRTGHAVQTEYARRSDEEETGYRNSEGVDGAMPHRGRERRRSAPSFAIQRREAERIRRDPNAPELAVSSSPAYAEHATRAPRLPPPEESSDRHAVAGSLPFPSEHTGVQEISRLSRSSRDPQEEVTPTEGTEYVETAALLKEAEMWVRMLPLWPPADWDKVIDYFHREEEKRETEEERETEEDEEEHGKEEASCFAETVDENVASEDGEAGGRNAKQAAKHRGDGVFARRIHKRVERGEAQISANPTEKQEEHCFENGYLLKQREESPSRGESRTARPKASASQEKTTELEIEGTESLGKEARNCEKYDSTHFPRPVHPRPLSAPSTQPGSMSSCQEPADLLFQFGLVMGADGLELLREMLKLKGSDRISAAWEVVITGIMMLPNQKDFRRAFQRLATNSQKPSRLAGVDRVAGKLCTSVPVPLKAANCRRAGTRLAVEDPQKGKTASSSMPTETGAEERNAECTPQIEEREKADAKEAPRPESRATEESGDERESDRPEQREETQGEGLRKSRGSEGGNLASANLTSGEDDEAANGAKAQGVALP